MLSCMQSYVVLGKWTDQGMREVSAAPKRIKITRQMIEKAGGKMQLYYTMGEYDFIMVVQIPRDEDMATVLLCVGSMGNIRTKTLKAWTEEEGVKILATPHP